MTTAATYSFSFQPHQILYLDCDQSRLYTEAIEILVERRLAWVRPLVLVTPEQAFPLAMSAVLGLESQGYGDCPTIPDLLWPLDQFYPALDTDFLSLLDILPNQGEGHVILAHGGAVSQFTRCLWEKTMTQSPPTPLNR